MTRALRYFPQLTVNIISLISIYSAECDLPIRRYQMSQMGCDIRLPADIGAVVKYRITEKYDVLHYINLLESVRDDYRALTPHHVDHEDFVKLL